MSESILLISKSVETVQLEMDSIANLNYINPMQFGNKVGI